MVLPNQLNTNQLSNSKNKGYTLVELVIVISIIGVLIAIAAPNFIGHTYKAKKVVCDKKCSQLEAMYKSYLLSENIKHSETVLFQFLQDYGEDICPDGGDIVYRGEEIQCIVHSIDDDETVPIL